MKLLSNDIAIVFVAFFILQKIKSLYRLETADLPVELDITDVSILKSLMEDGRKSFCAISREIKVSTPTVKARYDRLVKMWLVKSVKPKIDFHKQDQFFSEEKH